MAELLDRWLAHLEDLGRSSSTLYGYRKYVDRELIPAIGAVRLSKLTAGHLERLYSSLCRHGLAPATVRQIHAIVRAALHQAVRWGLTGRNVASLASAPSQPQREQPLAMIAVCLVALRRTSCSRPTTSESDASRT